MLGYSKREPRGRPGCGCLGAPVALPVEQLAKRERKEQSMSFRPTISIYLNKHIIDCGYYRNWSEEGLMEECCLLAQALDGCKTRQEVMERLGRTYGIEVWERGEEHQFYMSFPYDEEVKRHDSHLVERLCPLSVPASYCDDEDLLKEIEFRSEFPIFIDLTDRCFYWNPRGFIAHPSSEPVKRSYIYEEANQTEGGWLVGGRISFDLAGYLMKKGGR